MRVVAVDADQVALSHFLVKAESSPLFLVAGGADHVPAGLEQLSVT